MKLQKKKANKSKRVLGMIRTVVSRDEDVILRPFLEYCVQVWNPHLKKDVGMLEGMQRRATRMIK